LRAFEYAAATAPVAIRSASVSRDPGEQAAAPTGVDLGGAETREGVGARAPQNAVPAGTAVAARDAVERYRPAARVRAIGRAARRAIGSACNLAIFAWRARLAREAQTPTTRVGRAIAHALHVAIIGTLPHATAAAGGGRRAIQHAASATTVHAELRVHADGPRRAIAHHDALSAGATSGPRRRVERDVDIAAARVGSGRPADDLIGAIAGVDPVEAREVDLRIERLASPARISRLRAIADQPALAITGPNATAGATWAARLRDECGAAPAHIEATHALAHEDTVVIALPTSGLTRSARFARCRAPRRLGLAIARRESANIWARECVRRGLLVAVRTCDDHRQAHQPKHARDLPPPDAAVSGLECAMKGSCWHGATTTETVERGALASDLTVQ
jgi:hypothetical protein